MPTIKIIWEIKMQNNALTILNNDFSIPAPSDFFSYTRAVMQIPSLNKDEEKELVDKWVENKDAQAAKWLVLSNLHLVVKIVKNHKGYGLSEGDMAQEGTVGLMKAVHKFDPSKGVRLATYAWYWIEAEIKEFILKNWRMVSWGTSTLAKKLFFGYRKTVASLQNIGDERKFPSVEEIAKSMDVSKENAQMAHRFFMGADVEAVEEYDEENLDFAPQNSNSSIVKTELTPYDEVEIGDRKNQMMAISQSVDKLNERHQKIIKARYYLDPPKTLSHIAKDMNLSIERVRQLEKEAVGILKNKFS